MPASNWRVVAVTDIVDAASLSGKVLDTGEVLFQLHYVAVVFRCFPNEVADAVVTDVTADGFLASIGAVNDFSVEYRSDERAAFAKAVIDGGSQRACALAVGEPLSGKKMLFQTALADTDFVAVVHRTPRDCGKLDVCRTIGAWFAFSPHAAVRAKAEALQAAVAQRHTSSTLQLTLELIAETIQCGERTAVIVDRTQYLDDTSLRLAGASCKTSTEGDGQWLWLFAMTPQRARQTVDSAKSVIDAAGVDHEGETTMVTAATSAAGTPFQVGAVAGAAFTIAGGSYAGQSKALFFPALDALSSVSMAGVTATSTTGVTVWFSTVGGPVSIANCALTAQTHAVRTHAVTAAAGSLTIRGSTLHGTTVNAVKLEDTHDGPIAVSDCVVTCAGPTSSAFWIGGTINGGLSFSKTTVASLFWGLNIGTVQSALALTDVVITTTDPAGFGLNFAALVGAKVFISGGSISSVNRAVNVPLVDGTSSLALPA